MQSLRKLDIVRVGFIGVGSRSFGHLATMLLLDGVEVTAVCDNHTPSLYAAVKKCADAGRSSPAAYEDYRHLLDRQDVDVVIVATPWEFHVPMATAAMKAGKHAFVEVPAATTVDGCWELVETSEQTGMLCMMMENVNYGREELMVLNMCRQGVFGELLHGEAAYIHDLRWQMNEIEHGTGSWRTYEYTKRNGNLYPTHGLGPVAQYMNINRGDRLDYLSSVSAPARARAIYAKEHFPDGHERRSLDFICGDLSTTIVKTVLGKTMMIQWDEQLPRPYSRHNLIQGTRGLWAGFPNRCALEPPPLAAMVRAPEEEGVGGGGSGPLINAEHWMNAEDLQAIYDKYDHPLWKRLAKEAEEHGGHGGMDFVMLWRMVYCLRNGEPLDQDVYDAATWSVIGPLSEESVANRGKSMDIPDFTRGKWKTREPLRIVS